jgi:DNA polymerase III alpha subunit
MTLVDGVGPVAIENIRKAAPYVSFIDFIKRAEADKTVVVNLIWAGAFDNFPLEDGGVPVIDDPEKLFYAYFKSRHTLKRKEFQIEPEYANIDRVKKIINKVRVLPIVDYDYVLEFNDFLKRNNSYTFDNKVHYWNKKPVIRDFSRFEEVRKYWAGDVALIGIVASAVEKTYMDKKKNVEVKRIILTLENKGKTTDIILWDRMLQKISADDYRPGGLVALSGELRYDSYAHAIRLGCKRVERIM